MGTTLGWLDLVGVDFLALAFIVGRAIFLMAVFFDLATARGFLALRTFFFVAMGAF